MKSTLTLALVVSLLFAAIVVLGQAQATCTTCNCNTRAIEWPDGCPEYAIIAQPATPINPPCVANAYIRTVPDDEQGQTNTELIITVNHPEYVNGGAPQTVRLVQPAGQSTWYVAEVESWFACGKDEAPLAGTVREILNTRSLTPAQAAYNAPLPGPLLALLSDLAGLNPAHLHLVYLPLVSAPVPPVPTRTYTGHVFPPAAVPITLTLLYMDEPEYPGRVLSITTTNPERKRGA